MLRSSAKIVRTLLAREPLLPWLESRLAQCADDDLARRPPLLVLGSPRSGTTLLYESAVVGLGLACLPNLADLLPRSPVVSARIARRLAGRHREFSGRSRYGRLAAIHAPSEAGAWRRRLFGPADAPRPLTPAGVDELRATLRRLTRFGGASVCLKDTYDVLRLVGWRQAAPEAVVAHVRRDPLHVAQSLLIGRRTLFGDERKWLGVCPPAPESVRSADPIDQVAWQAATLDAFIEQRAREAGYDPLLTIDYEDLCRDPRGTMSRLADQLVARGADPPTRSLEALPASTPVANRQKLSDADWRRLRDAVSRAGDR